MVIEGVYLALFFCMWSREDAKQQRYGSSNTEMNGEGGRLAAGPIDKS
jgi:hypothetical protein